MGVGAAIAERVHGGAKRLAIFARAGSCRRTGEGPGHRTECWDWASSRLASGAAFRFCRVSTALITPAMPAAASVWPILLLIEPMMTRSSAAAIGAKHRADGARLGRIADRRAGAVALDIIHRLRIDVVGPADILDELLLRLAARHGNAGGLAVGIDACREHGREDGVAILESRLSKPLQQTRRPPPRPGHSRRRARRTTCIRRRARGTGPCSCRSDIDGGS